MHKFELEKQTFILSENRNNCIYTGLSSVQFVNEDV